MLALYQETDNPIQVNAAVFALVAAGLRVFAGHRAACRVPRRKNPALERRGLYGGALRCSISHCQRGASAIEPTGFSPHAVFPAPWSRRIAARCFIADNGQVQYLLVKPSDVPIYVEHGAADAGVVGRDVLLEGGNDVYELLDLGFGACRMCVAAPLNFREDLSAPLRVATKYPAIAKRFYAGKGREIEVIKLNGSIELAPILGLSDVIVDIVETGSTLKQKPSGSDRNRAFHQRAIHRQPGRGQI